ncbi:MFS general substrate transporter [Geomicrobium sp. JCM 19038]|nr:MFS general substrate transporter [Geomicrobium sp. JCM 19038]
MQRDDWKPRFLLLSTLGISSVGDFIYLVAINLFVFQLTGSAASVATLWLIGPLTNMVAKFWTGSFIDDRSKRKVMMVTYVCRAVFVACIPLAPNLFVVYLILVLLSVARAFYHPASMTFVTMTVPIEKRKTFNSLRSLFTSSAGIIGPAIGGALIMLTTVQLTFWINVSFFLMAAFLLWLMPDKEKREKEKIPTLTIAQVIQDFRVVQSFMKQQRYVALIYMSFILLMTVTFAMDAQEVVFTQQVIGLSEFEYSLLISLTGIGAIAGGLVLTMISKHLSIRVMIVMGLLLTISGYGIYALSWSFLSITVGFMILGFFNAFLYAGMTTFYQNNVPVEMMGRVTSIYDLIQSASQILLIFMLGLFADLFSLRATLIVFVSIMAIGAIGFSIAILNKQKDPLFFEQEDHRSA